MLEQLVNTFIEKGNRYLASQKEVLEKFRADIPTLVDSLIPDKDNPHISDEALRWGSTLANYNISDDVIAELAKMAGHEMTRDYFDHFEQVAVWNEGRGQIVIRRHNGIFASDGSELLQIDTGRNYVADVRNHRLARKEELENFFFGLKDAPLNFGYSCANVLDTCYALVEIFQYFAKQVNSDEETELSEKATNISHILTTDRGANSGAKNLIAEIVSELLGEEITIGHNNEDSPKQFHSLDELPEYVVFWRGGQVTIRFGDYWCCGSYIGYAKNISFPVQFYDIPGFSKEFTTAAHYLIKNKPNLSDKECIDTLKALGFETAGG